MVWMYLWIKFKKSRKQQQNIQEEIDTLKKERLSKRARIENA